jgi:hypothetical protein
MLCRLAAVKEVKKVDDITIDFITEGPVPILPNYLVAAAIMSEPWCDQFLPGGFDEVRLFFTRKGAYARFKDLLARRGALDQWYDFEANARKEP